MIGTNLFSAAPEIQGVLVKTRDGLKQLRETAGPFFQLVRALTSLDPNDREALKKAFADVRNALNKLTPQIAGAVKLVVDYLKQKGIRALTQRHWRVMWTSLWRC